MNLQFFKKKKADTTKHALERAVARNSPSLSISGKGPLADWILVLGLTGGLFIIFLWHGWYSYSIQSKKGFGPHTVEDAEVLQRTAIDTVLDFVSERAAVAPAASLPLVPPPAPVATSSAPIEGGDAFDAPIPGLR